MIDLDKFNDISAGDIQLKIADSIRQIRKRRRISQKILAARSGVSYASLRRFEKEGEISLSALVRLAIALDLQQELLDLFKDVPYTSIEEVLNDR